MVMHGADPMTPGSKNVTLCATLGRPFSRGTIHVSSPEPLAQPANDTHLFEQEWGTSLLAAAPLLSHAPSLNLALISSPRSPRSPRASRRGQVRAQSRGDGALRVPPRARGEPRARGPVRRGHRAVAEEAPRDRRAHDVVVLDAAAGEGWGRGRAVEGVRDGERAGRGSERRAAHGGGAYAECGVCGCGAGSGYHQGRV